MIRACAMAMIAAMACGCVGPEVGELVPPDGPISVMESLVRNETRLSIPIGVEML